VLTFPMAHNIDQAFRAVHVRMSVPTFNVKDERASKYFSPSILSGMAKNTDHNER